LNLESIVSDLELYKGLKNGDRYAITQIYERLLPRVSDWITSNNGSESDAHDIFQETLETILLKVDSVHSSFEGMVIRISKNKWIDRLRKKNIALKSRNENQMSEVENISLENIDIAYNKYRLMEKHFSALSEVCQKVMQMVKQGIAVSQIVQELSFSNANSLYRRKAACIERWSQLIKTDPLYNTLYE